jgi:hypothetical protein
MWIWIRNTGLKFTLETNEVGGQALTLLTKWMARHLIQQRRRGLTVSIWDSEAGGRRTVSIGGRWTVGGRGRRTVGGGDGAGCQIFGSVSLLKAAVAMVVLMRAAMAAALAAAAAEVGMEDHIGCRGRIKGKTFVLQSLDRKLLLMRKNRFWKKTIFWLYVFGEVG